MAFVAAGTYPIGGADRCAKYVLGQGFVHMWAPRCLVSPKHKAQVAAYYIDRTEVTLDQWDACVAAKGCGAITPEMRKGSTNGCADEEKFSKLAANGPVNCVLKAEAETYCHWKGKRLPTAVEWEVAGRSGDERVFSWGNWIPKDYAELSPKVCLVSKLCPVKSSGAFGRFRLYGIEGNLSEYVSTEPCELLPGDCTPGKSVTFGSSFYATELEHHMIPRTYVFLEPERYISVGFRCAKSAAKDDTTGREDNRPNIVEPNAQWPHRHGTNEDDRLIGTPLKEAL